MIVMRKTISPIKTKTRIKKRTRRMRWPSYSSKMRSSCPMTTTMRTAMNLKYS